MSTITTTSAAHPRAALRVLLVVLAVAAAMALVAVTTAYVVRAGTAPVVLDVPSRYEPALVGDPCGLSVVGEVVAC